MSEEIEQREEEQLPLGGVGQTLREAREAQGLDLKQVAAETRIPERHLLAIENSDFAALPARTYAVGFSRSYARMLGLDEKVIAADVRAELSAGSDAGRDRAEQFEPGDPARIPSRRLAWFSGLAALLLIVGGFSFYRNVIAPGSGPAPLVEQPAEQEIADEEQSANSEIDPQGEVVFTALEDGIWARFYDGNGSRLFEKQMAEGERFVVPADAQYPQIWTGRPDALAITIGGQTVPRLAEEDTVMRDVSIDAASLLARTDTATTEPTSTPTSIPDPAPARRISAPTPGSTSSPAPAARAISRPVVQPEPTPNASAPAGPAQATPVNDGDADGTVGATTEPASEPAATAASVDNSAT